MMPSVFRVLIVEDDLDQANLFKLILATAGYQVAAVPDVETAMAHLSENPVDLLFVDWNLPGTRGDIFITAVKLLYPTIITLLASNHLYLKEAALACGADACFRKMEGNAALRQLLTELLSKRVAVEVTA